MMFRSLNYSKLYFFACIFSIIVMPAIDINPIFANQDAENPCYFCHVDLIFDCKDGPHENAGISCKECHGESDGHVFTEDNSEKPDKLYKFVEVGEFCGGCHEAEYSNYKLSRHSSGVKGEVKYSPTCSTCHSAHKTKSKEMIINNCLECHYSEASENNFKTVPEINKSDLLLYDVHSLKKK